MTKIAAIVAEIAAAAAMGLMLGFKLEVEWCISVLACVPTYLGCWIYRQARKATKG